MGVGGGFDPSFERGNGIKGAIKSEMHLSIKDIADYQKRLESYPGDINKACENIVRRLADVMMNYVLMNGEAKYSPRNPYGNSKRIPVRKMKTRVTGGIHDDSKIAPFFEFGTGVKGKENPHIDEWLIQYGWIYDTNSHGTRGWFYPTTAEDPNPYKRTYNGQLYAWTMGIPAQKIYYQALERAKEQFQKIGIEELEKGLKK